MLHVQVKADLMVASHCLLVDCKDYEASGVEVGKEVWPYQSNKFVQEETMICAHLRLHSCTKSFVPAWAGATVNTIGYLDSNKADKRQDPLLPALLEALQY